MKKVILLIMLLSSVLAIQLMHAQSTDSNTRLALSYVKKAGPVIVGCCASYPIEVESNYISHRTLNNGRLLIEMSVTWTSDTYTNCHVKVEGELTVNRNGCSPSWLYKDSYKNLGCFIRPGCRWTCTTNFSECL